MVVGKLNARLIIVKTLERKIMKRSIKSKRKLKHILNSKIFRKLNHPEDVPMNSSTVSIAIDRETIRYFMDLSKENNVNYCELIKDALRYIVREKLKPKIIWVQDG